MLLFKKLCFSPLSPESHHIIMTSSPQSISEDTELSALQRYMRSCSLSLPFCVIFCPNVFFPPTISLNLSAFHWILKSTMLHALPQQDETAQSCLVWGERTQPDDIPDWHLSLSPSNRCPGQPERLKHPFLTDQPPSVSKTSTKTVFPPSVSLPPCVWLLKTEVNILSHIRIESKINASFSSKKVVNENERCLYFPSKSRETLIRFCYVCFV